MLVVLLIEMTWYDGDHLLGGLRMRSEACSVNWRLLNLSDGDFELSFVIGVYGDAFAWPVQSIAIYSRSVCVWWICFDRMWPSTDWVVTTRNNPTDTIFNWCSKTVFCIENYPGISFYYHSSRKLMKLCDILCDDTLLKEIVA